MQEEFVGEGREVAWFLWILGFDLENGKSSEFFCY